MSGFNMNDKLVFGCHFSKTSAGLIPMLVCGVFRYENRKRLTSPYDLGAVLAHYLPKTEDLLASLSGGEKFTKLDLSQAYQQQLLDEQSQECLTINTHKELYKPTHLQFGVHSVAGIFQREMEKRLSHVPFTTVQVDDILLSGRNDAEHLKNLTEVLQILSANRLRLKWKKCVFMAPEVAYLGFRINQEGVSPVDEKIKANSRSTSPSECYSAEEFPRYAKLLSLSCS